MKNILLLVVAALTCALSSLASADRLVVLVGSRHCYTMTYPDPYETQRQGIEEIYLSTKAQAQADYDNHYISGADLEMLITIAANRRDAALERYYTRCDELRSQYTELVVEEDGVYQPLCFERNASFTILEIVLYEPYRGYGHRTWCGIEYGHHPYKQFHAAVTLYHHPESRNRDVFGQNRNQVRPPTAGRSKDKPNDLNIHSNPNNGIRQPNQGGRPPRGNDKSTPPKLPNPDKGKKDNGKDRHPH